MRILLILTVFADKTLKNTTEQIWGRTKHLKTHEDKFSFLSHRLISLVKALY